MKKSFLLLIFVFMINNCFSSDNFLDRGYNDPLIPCMITKTPKAWGVEVGLNYNIFSQKINYDEKYEKLLYSNLSKGNGFSYNLGIFYDYEFNDYFAFHGKLQYLTVNFDNNGNAYIDAFKINNETKVIKELALSNIKWENELHYFSLEPSLRFNFTQKFFGLFGFVLQYCHEYKTTINKSIIDENFYFSSEDNTETKSLEESNTININNRIGLGFGLGYIFLEDYGIQIVPQINYHYFITNFDNNEFNVPDNSQFNTNGILLFNAIDKHLNYFRLTIAFWYDVYFP